MGTKLNIIKQASISELCVFVKFVRYICMYMLSIRVINKCLHILLRENVLLLVPLVYEVCKERRLFYFFRSITCKPFARVIAASTSALLLSLAKLEWSQ